MATHKGVQRAPLLLLPIISEPFSGTEMGIVGPLLRSRSGNKYKYILFIHVIMQLEVVPLNSIDADTIAKELIKVFPHVEVLREILTDQGTSFTSQLLAELYRLSQVKPICTSPYHPQTVGLVKHFN